MTLQGVPESSYYRVFVQARHIYSFATIGRLGWQGPWQDLIAETMQAILVGARRADGFFVHQLNGNAQPLDARADLYDQAFVLLALGTVGGALAEPRWFDVAEELLDTIERNWSHPTGGFKEGEKVDASVRRQNPHMHLLEAALALYESSGRPRFAAFATMIADLAATHFIDPATGALLEYFKEDLAPAAGIDGCIVEPGHCFEWAWLFERLGNMGRDGAHAVADRLVGFARTNGLCSRRGVCVNEVLTNGNLHDGRARLWPQTERIKAAAIRHRRLGDPSETDEVARALAGLELYYTDLPPGLWRDKLNPDGSWIPEFSPGSSLYHIACAYGELVGAA
jgi:mannose-6-phosphate isomerase